MSKNELSGDGRVQLDAVGAVAEISGYARRNVMQPDLGGCESRMLGVDDQVSVDDGELLIARTEACDATGTTSPEQRKQS